jgi:hypothetical protein
MTYLPANLARIHLIALAALLVWAGPSLAGTQWKWRDTSGNIQYSDRPPPSGTPDQAILGRPSTGRQQPPKADAASVASNVPSQASAPQPAKAAEPELDAKRRKVEEERLAKQKAEDDKQAKTRADNCQRARSYMKTLNDGIRIARTSATGEREILDDKGRADETQRTQEVIQGNCK